VKDMAGPLLTLVSPKFAPQVSGSTILLANLLSGYPGRVSAISGQDAETRADPAFASPCPVRHLPLSRRLARVSGFMRRRYPEVLRRMLRIPIARSLRAAGASVVMGTFPNDVYLVAGFLAARSLQLPFYAHMHDLWVENTSPQSPGGRFAEKWEPVILSEATRVVCMTEAMQQHYAAKYGIKTELIPHCVREEDVPDATPLRAPRPGPVVVLFVGAVSPPMNLDALKVLAAAVDLLPSDYELVFCTAADQATLKGLGIASPRLRVMYVSRAEVQRLQSAAHVRGAPPSDQKNCPHKGRKVVYKNMLE
jgi:glycosyltransferase involved in cell wall biosynthesis